MNAWDWYLDAWHNFGNFEGRSSRPAFWYFCLVNLIVVFMCLFLDVAIFGEADFPVLTALYGLAAVIPGLSLSVRRLHDAGRSGWWLLVGVVPVVGQLAVLVFLVSASQPPTEMRLCPFCAEEIKFAAIKCKHCGEFLTEKPNEFSTEKPNEGTDAARYDRMAERSDDWVFKALLLLIVLVFAFVVVVGLILQSNS